MVEMLNIITTRLTPAFAFASFFVGFYGLLVATSRSDWAIVGTLAMVTIGCAVAAFVLRKSRPNLTFALVTLPALLLFAVVVLR